MSPDDIYAKYKLSPFLYYMNTNIVCFKEKKREKDRRLTELYNLVRLSCSKL